MLHSGLKILYISAEVSPFAKTGGLADVAGSLPQELFAMGNDVRVAMPRYGRVEGSLEYVADFPVRMGNRVETCIVRKGALKSGSEGENIGVPVYFIDNYHYFDREGIYCYADDADRFIFFCKAVLEMLPEIGFKPDVIHCNDWHTGPVCMLLKECFNRKPSYKGISTVFTIHNLEYQGQFSQDVVSLFNLETDIFTPEKVEFYGGFNFMKSGLVYADKINTVSETYAREIQTAEYGERLDGLLRKRADDLYGIVNGISYHEFNPEKDTRIYRNYSVNSTELKVENKRALQKEMGLPEGDMPIIGLISRLVEQKGLNLIVEKLEELLSQDIQLVILGVGDPYYENAFKEASLAHPDKLAVNIRFDPALAQRIYAGSDMFLMPSRFEPCGLGQIISLRYGTIPIVRATGGLAETVADIDAAGSEGNGFVFTEYSSREMMNSVERALNLYTQERDSWQSLVRKAMGLDFSWRKPAEKYMELYKRALAD